MTFNTSDIKGDIMNKRKKPMDLVNIRTYLNFTIPLSFFSNTLKTVLPFYKQLPESAVHPIKLQKEMLFPLLPHRRGLLSLS